MSYTVTSSYSGRSGSWGEKNTRRYRRQFHLLSDSLLDETDVLLATGIPKYLDAYGPADLAALCTSIRADQDPENQWVWHVEAEYSTDLGEQQRRDQDNPNPLLRPAVWKYASVRATRTEPKDRRGNAYQNRAGQPFKSPPETPYATARYTITRNESSFSGDLADHYAWTVNSASWYGKPAGTVLCKGIEAEEVYEADYRFFRVSYSLHVDRNKWQPVQVANKGMLYKKQSDGKYYLSADENGIYTPEEIWLNAQGDKWTSANPESEKYIEFYPFDERDFSALAL